jgi:hypothetical protein
MRSKFDDKQFWIKFVNFYSQEKSDQDMYSHLPKLFFYQLFRIFGLSLWHSIEDIFSPLCVSNDKSEQRLASEYFAGLVHSIKSWELEDIKKIEEKLSKMLDNILIHIGPYSLMNWLFAFHDATVS